MTVIFAISFIFQVENSMQILAIMIFLFQWSYTDVSELFEKYSKR